MRGVLAGRRGAVVTAGTVAGDTAVIESRRYPAIGGVTKIAGIVAGDVINRLTGGGGAVVTAETATDNVCVIDPDDR